MLLEFREKLKKMFYRKPVIWPLLIWLKGLLYSFNYWYYYLTPWGKKNVSLREINLEFNSSCNLRCQFCALDFDKPRQVMSAEVLQKVLFELETDVRLVNIQRINLYNGGETLLHPDRLAMLNLIGAAKQKARSENHRFPEVHLLTNGMLLREKLALQIIETGALDVIQFSLDGGTPERFESLRVNAKWQVFFQNVKNLHRLIHETGAMIQMKSITIVEEPHPLNESWMHPEFRELLGLMDHFELRRLHDWGGEVEIGGNQSKRVNKKGCSLLMHQMVVLPNGDVTVCCNDLNSKGVIGSMLQQSLYDVYTSEARMEYVVKLNQGKKAELPLCAHCESF
jgi:sulfatase maturation enzyme AslB (radical SAM superfamily)